MIPETMVNALINAGGTALVAGIFLWYLDRVDKRTNTLISNHLQHSTDAMEKMSIALTKLITTINGLRKFLGGK